MAIDSNKRLREKKVWLASLEQSIVRPDGSPLYGRRFVIIGLLLFSVVLFGTVGYMLLEGWSFLDSLYMTVITVSTVGFGEIRPLCDSGRVLTIGVILCGVSLVAYTASTLTQMVVEGKIRLVLGRRIMENRLKNLKGHVVVCGFGRIGQVLCSGLEQAGKSFVIIEQEERAVREAQGKDYLALHGNGNEEIMLRRAKIDTAEALVSTVSCDADNVFLALEAREMNPSIYIVVRAYLPRNVKHLRKAGADRVISPDIDGGYRMTQAVLRSAVHEFLDITSHKGVMELRIDEVMVGPQCTILGKTIKEADIRNRTGLIIVAVKRGDEEMIFNPGPETTVQSGDAFVTLGSGSHQEAFEKILGSRPETA